MWWKLLLLALYVALLFVLSRVLETVAYYEDAFLATRLLDPVSLSVRKLKLLLDQRGVSYAGVVEKHELTQLIQQSGEILEGELEAATHTSQSTLTPANFTGSVHFHEEVEDTKDSVWVVRVRSPHQNDVLTSEEWYTLVQKLHPFGVRTGVFDCAQQVSLCHRKGWLTSRLILAVPRGFRAKDQVILRSYTGPANIQAVFDWVNTHLASRMQEITSVEELEKHWLIVDSDGQFSSSVPANTSSSQDDDSSLSPLRVLFFSQLPIPPMFLSVLSVKFTGRVRFGTVNTNTREGKNILNKMRLAKAPCYLVVTLDRTHRFGEKRGEYWNYRSLSLLLRTLHPEVNDMFLLSLVLVNVLCWFELATARGSLVRRLGSCIWLVGKMNFLLILLWLPLLGLCRLSVVSRGLAHALRALQAAALTPVACQLRADWLMFTGHATFLPATFLLYALLVAGLHYFYQSEAVPDTNNNVSAGGGWWRPDWEAYMSSLFRPVTSFTRPIATNDDIEVGMEMLIERLAVPDLWLRPMISPDYIQDLPVWRYSGPVIDSDLGSDVQSDGEAGYLSDADSVCSAASSEGSLSRHRNYFTCSRCRALAEAAALEAAGLSEQEAAEVRRQAAESACVKYLMDGDYRCLCGGSHTPRRERKHSRVRARGRGVVTAAGVEAAAGCETEGCDTEEPGEDVPDGMIPCTECAICLESYKPGALLCGLPCAHNFHQACIFGWLHRDNHACPVCRWPSYKAKPCSLHAHID